MQQGEGGQYREMGGVTTGAVNSIHVVREQSEQLVEEVSPISSRPPASAERLASSGRGGEDEGDLAGGGDGGGAGVGSSGNRWPRQETVALLKIRSDMDVIFRDAAVKGPLWEDVSRKLAELGYKRSAKKCKEKFENVHKYYKRTKEGRQGGKSYKFFTQLETFYTSPATMDAPPPVSVRNIAPCQVSVAAPPITNAFEIDFSSNSSSSSHGFNEDDIDEDEIGEPSDTRGGTSHKRKRQSSSGTTKMMMEYLEGLMKQVMHKQELSQQRFLEALEKREQDRMIREEAWKRQETLRLTREHELMARERAVASSRDDAIMNFLEKITGQSIPVSVTPTPPPQTQPATVPDVVPSAPVPSPTPPINQPPSAPVPSPTPPINQPPSAPVPSPTPPINQPPPPQPLIPEQQMVLQEIGGSGNMQPASSRWPKEEVLALISLRSGLDTRYQDVGPKGPLWEEISAGMSRMGYKRNAKRCKEKWENINKYYKKVKESSKKRPEDAKTCPYFHQLDALHRSKILGGGTSGGSSSFGHQNRPEEEMSLPQQDIGDAQLMRQPSLDQSENKTAATVDVITNKEGLTGSLFGEGNGGASKKVNLFSYKYNHQSII